MSIFGRAIRYCWRQKLRSMILLLALTLLAFLALLALWAGRASAGETESVKKTVGAAIHISIDSGNTKLYGNAEQNDSGITYQYNGDYITQEVIDAIAGVDGVVNYSAESEGGYWGAAVDFEYFQGNFNISYTDYGQSVPYTVTLDSSLNQKFINGTYTLEAGRHITPEDSYAVLISKELAEKNGLAVGDHITLYSLDSNAEDSFEIVGIFSGTEGLSKDAIMSDGIAANQGYIDMNSYNDIFRQTSLELGSLDVYVDSAENVENILEVIQNLPELKDKTFVYATDTESFALISAPLSSFQTMVNTAVAAIGAVGAALVTLLLTVWTRSRKREAGILMAVGISKGKILLQFITENLMLALLAAFLSFGMTCGLEVLQPGMEIPAVYIAGVYGTGLLILAAAVLFSAASIMRMKPAAAYRQMD